MNWRIVLLSLPFILGKLNYPRLKCDGDSMAKWVFVGFAGRSTIGRTGE
jgi:hypothetical protein